jgi:imidazolonepropionase-like amidohydrolase
MRHFRLLVSAPRCPWPVRLAVALVWAAPVAVASAQSPTLPPPGAPAGVMAFVDVAVIPMDTERVLANQTVLVEGGRITALGPSSTVKVPAKATRIDGRGKHLIPGLADMHLHVGATHNWVLSAALAYGVTTVRITHGSPWHVGLRQQVATGTVLGPRIYTSGPVLGLGSFRSPEAAAQLVAQHQQAGYDFLKIRVDQRGFNPEVFDTLFAAAKRAQLRIMGHTPPGLGLERVLQAGPASIEHLAGYVPAISGTVLETDIKKLSQVDDAKLAELAAATQRSGVWNCPTLVVRKAVAPRWFPVGWEKYIVLVGKVTKALQDAGAGLLLGTDASGSPLGLPPGVSVHNELQALVDAGLTPYQALVAGTRNPAAFMGTVDSTGTVEVGKRADLVLLNGNPLDDIRHSRQIAGVMVGGRWLGRQEIDAFSLEEKFKEFKAYPP